LGTNILTLDNHGKYGDPHSQYLNAYKFIPVGYISGATNPELKPVKIGTISFRKEQYEETDDSYDYRIFLMFHIFSDPNGLTNNGALNDIYTINFTATSDGSNIRDISIENLTNHTFYGRCIVDLVTYTSSVVRADIYLRLDVNKPCYVSVIKNGVYLTDCMEDTRSDMAQFFPYLTDTPSNLTVLDTFVHPYYEKASQHSYFVFDTGKTPVSTKINSFGSNAVLKITYWYLH
jgi:hypothetical protein